MEKTYHGSCHCGAVAFEATLDLQAGTGKCNCSYCSKTRAWGLLIKPDAFTVVSPVDRSIEYRFGSMSNAHKICGICGVHTHSEGNIEQMGGAFVAVQVSALDDVSVAELTQAPVTFQNGRENAWWEQPTSTSYL